MAERANTIVNEKYEEERGELVWEECGSGVREAGGYVAVARSTRLPRQAVIG